jgi:hypothetical protein
MGSVEAKDVPGGTFSSAYGSVDVTLSSKFSGTIEASSAFGSIDSDFELRDRHKKKKRSYGPQKLDLVGKVGGGSDRLVIKSKFGDVSISGK